MSRLVLGACVGLAVMSMTSYHAAKSQGPAGQIIFSAVQDLGSKGSSAGSGDLEIVDCTREPDGILVRGTVTVSSGSARVLVEGGVRGTPGQRVGVAYASDARLFEGAKPGDFQVLIPWAGTGALFALDLGGPLQGRERRHSEPVSCPLSSP